MDSDKARHEADASTSMNLTISKVNSIGAVEEYKFRKRLISEVRKFPELYNPRTKQFSNTECKAAAWQKIGLSLTTDVEACRSAWADLRYEYQEFVRCLRKFIRTGNKSRKRRPMMMLETQLLFLWPHIADDQGCKLPYPTAAKRKRTVVVGAKKVAKVNKVVKITKAVRVTRTRAASKTTTAPLVDDDIMVIEDDPVIINLDDDEDSSSNSHNSHIVTNDLRSLIDSIKYYPELYDRHNIYYSDYKRKGIIWNAIANELGDKATKLMKMWIYVQTRYEYEISGSPTNEKSALAEVMSFFEKHVLTNPVTVYKQSFFLKKCWVEPIENFRSINGLLTLMKKNTRIINLTEEGLTNPVKDDAYFMLWNSVGRLRGTSAAQCEVSWLIMRSFYWELMQMRAQSYQLQDKWFFEATITELYAYAAQKLNKTTVAKNVQRQRQLDQPLNQDQLVHPYQKLVAEPLQKVVAQPIPQLSQQQTQQSQLKTAVQKLLQAPPQKPSKLPLQEPQQQQLSIAPMQKVRVLLQAPQRRSSTYVQMPPLAPLPHQPHMPAALPKTKSPPAPSGLLPLRQPAALSVATPAPQSSDPPVLQPIALSCPLPIMDALSMLSTQPVFNSSTISHPPLIFTNTPLHTLPNTALHSPPLLIPRPAPLPKDDLVPASVHVPSAAAVSEKAPTAPAKITLPTRFNTAVVDDGNTNPKIRIRSDALTVRKTAVKRPRLTPVKGYHTSPGRKNTSATLKTPPDYKVELIHSLDGIKLSVTAPTPSDVNIMMPQDTAQQFVRDIMSMPLLHNKYSTNFPKIDAYWKRLGQRFSMSVVICKAVWCYLRDNDDILTLVVPFDLMIQPLKTESNIWKTTPQMFMTFDVNAVKRGWLRYSGVLPLVMLEIAKHPCMYDDLVTYKGQRKYRPDPKAAVEAAWKAVYTALPQTYGVPWSEMWMGFKNAYYRYIADLEHCNDNKWPKNWWRVLANMTFLVEYRHADHGPLYYIIRNKISDEISTHSKREKAEKAARKSTSGSHLLPTRKDDATNSPAYKLRQTFNPQINEYILMATVLRHPKIYEQCPNGLKLHAWEQVAAHMKTSVINCRLAFQNAVNNYRHFLATSSQDTCLVNKSYYKPMEEIFRSILPVQKINVRTPTELNKSVASVEVLANSPVPINSPTLSPPPTVSAPPTTSKEAAKSTEESTSTEMTTSTEVTSSVVYMPEITMCNSKPKAVMNNWITAISSMPEDAQNQLTQKLIGIFKKYNDTETSTLTDNKTNNVI